LKPSVDCSFFSEPSFFFPLCVLSLRTVVKPFSSQLPAMNVQRAFFVLPTCLLFLFRRACADADGLCARPSFPDFGSPPTAVGRIQYFFPFAFSPDGGFSTKSCATERGNFSYLPSFLDPVLPFPPFLRRGSGTAFR